MSFPICLGVPASAGLLPEGVLQWAYGRGGVIPSGAAPVGGTDEWGTPLFIARASFKGSVLVGAIGSGPRYASGAIFAQGGGETVAPEYEVLLGCSAGYALAFTQWAPGYGAPPGSAIAGRSPTGEPLLAGVTTFTAEGSGKQVTLPGYVSALPSSPAQGACVVALSGGVSVVPTARIVVAVPQAPPPPQQQRQQFAPTYAPQQQMVPMGVPMMGAPVYGAPMMVGQPMYGAPMYGAPGPPQQTIIIDERGGYGHHHHHRGGYYGDPYYNNNRGGGMGTAAAAGVGVLGGLLLADALF